METLDQMWGLIGSVAHERRDSVDIGTHFEREMEDVGVISREMGAEVVRQKCTQDIVFG